MNLNNVKSLRRRAAWIALPGLSKLNWRARASVLFSLLVISVIPLPAQTFTTLHTFSGPDGEYPVAALVQATDGSLYGTTSEGGANSNALCTGLGNGSTTCGTVFKITPGGTLTTLYSFCAQSNCTDGYEPTGALVLGTNGDLYGTTYYGGANGNYGTVFKITPTGTLTTLYSFCSQSGCTDGAYPYAGLTLATNGDFYGTTTGGAANGTVFKITPSGTLTTLYTFNPGAGNGAYPFWGVIQATNGDFYGTTKQGGADSLGMVFKITPTGTLTSVYSFPGTVGTGNTPTGGLVQGANGDFYGATAYSGDNNNPGGTVFQLTPGGTLTTLFIFCPQNSCATTGSDPNGVIQATDGNLYGTQYSGGGADFEVTLSGVFTQLNDFGYPGAGPDVGLTQATDGTFYGSTLGSSGNACGGGGCGTIFSLSVGLGPFVALQTTSGKEGAVIGILGQGFSSSSVVKFGGTQATKISRTGTTFVKATVPAAALTGSVTVTTGATTLTSSQSFRVTPTITSFSPSSGPVGTPVTITGTGLLQATKVTFNGKSAAITVNSDTQITATVPTGATTGKIMVTTPGGSATSATSFTVN